MTMIVQQNFEPEHLCKLKRQFIKKQEELVDLRDEIREYESGSPPDGSDPDHICKFIEGQHNLWRLKEELIKARKELNVLQHEIMREHKKVVQHWTSVLSSQDGSGETGTGADVGAGDNAAGDNAAGDKRPAKRLRSTIGNY